MQRQRKPAPAAPDKTAEEVPETSGLVPATLSMIERLATNPRADVAKFERLVELQERMVAREAEIKFNEAYMRLLPTLPRVRKNGRIEYTDKQGRITASVPYAKWEDIDTAIRPLLLAEGFTTTYDTELVDGGFVRIGYLHHVAGHTRSARTPPIPLDTSGGKNNLQAAGSTMSYGKRYTTADLLNLVFEGEDDDGMGGPLTQEQVAEIMALMKEAGVGPRFLKMMRADSVEKAGSVAAAVATIAARDYRKAITTLEERIAAKKAPE